MLAGVGGFLLGVVVLLILIGVFIGARTRK